MRLKSLTSVLCAVVVVAATFLTAPSANASGGTPPPPGIQYSVINLHTYPNSTLYALGAVGGCRNAGGTCTIQVSTSTATTIQASLGVSKAWVGGEIGMSYGTSTSTSTSCTSRKLKAGEVFRAYLVGTEKMYQVRRQQGGVVETSGWLFARKPYKNDIYCAVYTG